MRNGLAGLGQCGASIGWVSTQGPPVRLPVADCSFHFLDVPDGCRVVWNVWEADRMAQVRSSLCAGTARVDLCHIQLAPPFRLVSSRGVLRSLRHPSDILSHRMRCRFHRFGASNSSRHLLAVALWASWPLSRRGAFVSTTHSFSLYSWPIALNSPLSTTFLWSESTSTSLDSPCLPLCPPGALFRTGVSVLSMRLFLTSLRRHWKLWMSPGAAASPLGLLGSSRWIATARQRVVDVYENSYCSYSMPSTTDINYATAMTPERQRVLSNVSNSLSCLAKPKPKLPYDEFNIYLAADIEDITDVLE